MPASSPSSSASRQAPITGGIGTYRHATGRGTYIEHGAALGARDAQGNCVRRFKLNYVVARVTGTAGT